MNPATRVLRTVAAILVAVAACDAGTGGETVVVSLRAVSVPDAANPPGVFTTDTGWSVVLTEAKLVVSALYAFAPDPDAYETFVGLVRPSVARAHGGIDPLSGRRVRVESLGAFVLDGLSTATNDLGTVDAEAGAVDALELRLLPPPAELAAAVHGHHAYFAGTATKGAESVDFAGGIDIPDDGTRRRVEGIGLDAILDDGGALTLHAIPSTFFRGVLFERLPSEDPVSGVRALTIGSQPYEAVGLGVRNPRAYGTTYVSGAAP